MFFARPNASRTANAAPRWTTRWATCAAANWVPGPEIVVDDGGGTRRCVACCGGFLLNGYPRTVAQAEAMESLLKREKVPLTAVLNYELPIEEIVARLGGRHPSVAKRSIHHRGLPAPKVEGDCDKCGAKLLGARTTGPKPSACTWAAYKKAPVR